MSAALLSTMSYVTRSVQVEYVRLLCLLLYYRLCPRPVQVEYVRLLCLLLYYRLCPMSLGQCKWSM